MTETASSDTPNPYTMCTCGHLEWNHVERYLPWDDTTGPMPMPLCMGCSCAVFTGTNIVVGAH